MCSPLYHKRDFVVTIRNIFCFYDMDTYHVFWLLDELDVLAKKRVITEETAKRIADYYAAQSGSASPSAAEAASPAESASSSPSAPAVTDMAQKNIYADINKRVAAEKSRLKAIDVASIPVILSVIAAILIAAGVISLTAYNWNAIPRTVKAVFAFVLLLAVQAGGVVVSVREKLFSRTAWREGTAVLWSLMFGGVVAFISQICRLPGDTASFLLVWAVSSILLTYAMRSLGAFAVSLILLPAYVFACDGVGGPTFFFCLLFASLCPFALRFRYGRQIMLAVFAVMLNVILDGRVFGLRMVCNVSFAVLCLEYGMSRGSKGIKYLSAAALCILLLYLSFDDVWFGRNLDWNRAAGDGSVWGIVFDGFLASCFTGLAVAWQFVPCLCKKPFPWWKRAYPLCALVVCGLFVACGLVPQGSRLHSLCLAQTAMVFLFSLLFIVHVMFSRVSYSLFLMGFLIAASCIARLNLPVLALAAFLLLLVAAGAYPGALLRIAGFVLLLAATAYLLTMRDGRFVLYNHGALPAQLALYALYLLAAGWLFARSRSLMKSLDIIVVCAAVIVLSLLGLAFPLGEEIVCMAYFCVLLFVCAWHVAGARGGEDKGLWFYVLPFAALTVYFFWVAGFVMQMNCPVVSLSVFILLFEAAGCYRASRNEKDGRTAHVLSRLLTAAWMPCVALFLQEGGAFIVYKQGALPFQMVSCGLVALAALVLLVLSRRWKDSLDVLVILASLLLLSAALYYDEGTELNEKSLYAFLYILAGAGMYGFVRFRLHKRLEYLPYSVVFVFVTIVCLYHNTGSWFICPPVMPLLCGLYFFAKERESGTARQGMQGLSLLWSVLSAVLIFASAFAEGSFCHTRRLDFPQLVPVCLALLAYAFMAFLPAVALLRKKLRFNYVLALHALVVTGFLLFILASGISGNDPRTKILDKAMSFTSFACVFLAAGYFIYEAYMDGSLAKANVSACYAAFALVIKFFSDDYGFVAKGILFIALGVAMLLLNLLLCRVERKKKASGEVRNEVNG